MEVFEYLVEVARPRIFSEVITGLVFYVVNQAQLRKKCWNFILRLGHFFFYLGPKTITVEKILIAPNLSFLFPYSISLILDSVS